MQLTLLKFTEVFTEDGVGEREEKREGGVFLSLSVKKKRQGLMFHLKTKRKKKQFMAFFLPGAKERGRA